MTHFSLASVRATFRAVAVAFVPELSGANPDTWARLEATVERMLARQPRRMVRQLRLFHRVIDVAARVTRLRRLADLAPESRRLVLRRLERAPVLLLRRGVWGLRTLVFAGYYTQPDVVADIGYAATAAGWEAPR